MDVEQVSEEASKNKEPIDQTESQPVKRHCASTSPNQVASTSDIKVSTDSKNSHIRIVKGTKKIRIDSGDFTHTSDKKDAKDDESIEAKVVRSLKRSSELWSMEDKNTFFKAINEYGKDFDALQSYFLSQGKKKGVAEPKNKEQIRHFYYRTWHKISKHLKFSEDVKKASQELYGLINYGELRRKMPRMHEKAQLKLNELIYWGSTQVRLRGKTLRIKTPICRTLRKLNQLEDWQEEIKLPSKVSIELRPGNNLAWWQVQAAAMNPRVRALVPIQRRLSTLLIFLQQRWRSSKYKICANIESQAGGDFKESRLLRVAPPDGCKISLPTVNLGEYLTSDSVSLNSYEKKLCLKSSKLELLGSVQQLKGVRRRGIKKNRSDKRLRSRTEDQALPTDNNSDVDATDSTLMDKTLFGNDRPVSEHPNGPNRFPGRENVSRIRLGWNNEEANTITVGDLYLMFGRDSKILLEYWWDPPNREAQMQLTDKPKSISSFYDDTLSLALQKLLSIAKHSYGASKGYENNSGSNETVVSSRILSTKDSTFRRPLIPQPYHKIGPSDSFKSQLDKFKYRYGKRARTVRQKNLVQRVVPTQISKPPDKPAAFIHEESGGHPILQGPINNECEKNLDADEFDEQQGDETERKHFLGVLSSDEAQSNKPCNSIITSATQILKEGEQQWLNSEVADFSLSSFLGQLESSVKISQQSQVGGHIAEDTRPASDVVSQMQGLMGENSVDYLAKFANLASQIANDDHHKNK
ncbi:protein cramped-like isoform X1 [Neodiprion lecontei]|uniref:Protein cramped-like n=1 Tax=Neodiprion lecontei TaxID=441921 RepID=A0A6J0BTV4_NEOLC|nr:protein cramped-like isoform X1 [Neodiprion lecontei]XP_046599485.1 protein cramped-like isoform X1 [Neodiprion lecontei]